MNWQGNVPAEELLHNIRKYVRTNPGLIRLILEDRIYAVKYDFIRDQPPWVHEVSMSINCIPVIALIPARGGSKRLPGKNMRKLGEIPLVGTAIEAAKTSNYIDSIVVSSDDKEILDYAFQQQVTTLVRPAEYASDTSTALEVVMHFFLVMDQGQKKSDPYIVYLQPTSPLRTAAHIDEAITIMTKSKASTLVSVTEFEKSPFKGFSLDSTGRLQSLFDEKLSNARLQDLPPAYVTNGAIYIFRVSDFEARGGFPSNGSIPYLMDANCSIDIDTENDFERIKAIQESNG